MLYSYTMLILKNTFLHKAMVGVRNNSESSQKVAQIKRLCVPKLDGGEGKRFGVSTP